MLYIALLKLRLEYKIPRNFNTIPVQIVFCFCHAKRRQVATAQLVLRRVCLR